MLVVPLGWVVGLAGWVVGLTGWVVGLAGWVVEVLELEVVGAVVPPSPPQKNRKRH